MIRKTIVMMAAIDRHVTVSRTEIDAPSVNHTTSDSDSDNDSDMRVTVTVSHVSNTLDKCKTFHYTNDQRNK